MRIMVDTKRESGSIATEPSSCISCPVARVHGATSGLRFGLFVRNCGLQLKILPTSIWRQCQCVVTPESQNLWWLRGVAC